MRAPTDTEMRLPQWARLVMLVFVLNGTYLGHAEKWQEMEVSGCEGSGGENEEEKDKIPKDLQQLLMTLIMVTGVIVIMAAAAVWLRLKIVKADTSDIEELQGGFCCKMWRFLIYPSTNLPLWQSLLLKGLFTATTTVVGGVMSMFFINILSPKQE